VDIKGGAVLRELGTPVRGVEVSIK